MRRAEEKFTMRVGAGEGEAREMEPQCVIDFSRYPQTMARRVATSPVEVGGGVGQVKPAYLEFFAGSGLVAAALEEHFSAVWANDICQKKAAVYIANHGSSHFHLGSIADVQGGDLPAAELAWASFPCQDLSLAGLAEGIHGARSGLVWQWLRVIDEMPKSPNVLVAENVAGLVSVDGGRHYRQLHRALSQRGYRVGAMLLDASRWLPQSRPRIFVVAVAAHAPIPAGLMDTGPNWLHGGSVCKAVEGLDDFIWWRMPEPSLRNYRLSDIVEWDAPFSAVEADRRNIALISPRHRQILESLPAARAHAVPGYKRTRAGKQVLELRFDDVAGCLRTPRGGSSRQVIVIRRAGELHSRLLTIREAARLMGAPEGFKIPGSYNEGYTAMGDGVAVPVARWLAVHLLAPLVAPFIQGRAYATY
jgi:DNA (cytosine-5)-methyltransferase 1